jgi:competence protein ComEA
MPPPDLKPYRLYIAMFLVNLAVVLGVIYLLRRPEPRAVTVTLPTPPPAPASIRVAVTGAVRRPGSLELAAPARLADALQAAVLAPDADLSQLDLTAPLHPGDTIHVPARATNAPPADTLGIAGAPAPGKLNLNTATLAELDALPGIGPALAQRILALRAEKGRFTSIEQLIEVNGIGDTLFQDLKPLVTVE